MSKTAADPFRTLFAFVVAFIAFMLIFITQAIVAGETSYHYAKEDNCINAAWDMPKGSAKLYDAFETALHDC